MGHPARTWENAVGGEIMIALKRSYRRVGAPGLQDEGASSCRPGSLTKRWSNAGKRRVLPQSQQRPAGWDGEGENGAGRGIINRTIHGPRGGQRTVRPTRDVGLTANGRARHSVRAVGRGPTKRTVHNVRGGQRTARPTGALARFSPPLPTLLTLNRGRGCLISPYGRE